MTPPREIPHDEASERHILGALLLDARLANQVLPRLREDDFYRPAHRRIFGAIVAVTSEGQPSDTASVGEMLQRRGELAAVGGKEYLDELFFDTATAANVDTPIRLLREYSERRALLDFANGIVELAMSGSAPAERVRTDALAGLLALMPTQTAGGFRKLELHAVCDDIDRRSRGEGGGLRFGHGFEPFDRQTQGLKRGELVILCAAPKVGKSTVAGQIAMQVALSGQGGVGYVSAEMSNHSITERLLSAIAGVPIARMRAGTLHGAEWSRLAHASGRLGTSPLWVDDSAVPRLEDVVARSLALKAQHPELELIVVDFLQLIRFPLKGRRGDEELEAIAYGLTDLAKRAQVVVLAPTQLNVKAIEDRADRRPQLRDISGSSGPLKAADFVVLLHRASPEDLERGAMDHLVLNVEGTRRTPQFDFVLPWQATVMRGVSAEPDRWVRPDEPLVIAPFPRIA